MADRSANLIDHVTPSPSEPSSGARVTALPAPPSRPLTEVPATWPTDADVDHALGAYGSYDRFQFAADRAFGEDLPGGAA
jgi:hypothetical protein